MLFDLTKAYQQLITGAMERNLRRFLHRWSQDSDWQVFAYDRVTFGDIVAGLCLELAKALLAQYGQEIDSLACSRLLAATFCDDHCGGGNPQ